MKKEEFEAYYDEAIRDVDDDMDCLQEKVRRKEAHRCVLDAARDAYLKVDKLNDELERKQQEIDDLEEELEQKDAEIADLRRQLLEAQNQQLETEKQQLELERQHLEAEVKAKPTEIHNHFGAGSTSQVFNDKVNGKFIRKQNDKKNDKKKEKKRWKRIVGKVL